MKDQLEKELQIKIEEATLRFKNNFDWNNKSEVLITYNMYSKLIQEIIEFKSKRNIEHVRLTKVTEDLKDILISIETILKLKV